MPDSADADVEAPRVECAEKQDVSTLLRCSTSFSLQWWMRLPAHEELLLPETALSVSALSSTPLYVPSILSSI